MYISSADFMTRNTERRVEVAAPILDKALSNRVCDIFATMLADNIKARELGADGKYTHVSSAGKLPLNSQLYFYDEAYKAAAASTGIIGREKPAVKAIAKPDDRNEPIRVKIKRIRR